MKNKLIIDKKTEKNLVKVEFTYIVLMDRRESNFDVKKHELMVKGSSKLNASEWYWDFPNRCKSCSHFIQEKMFCQIHKVYSSQHDPACIHLDKKEESSEFYIKKLQLLYNEQEKQKNKDKTCFNDELAELELTIDSLIHNYTD